MKKARFRKFPKTPLLAVDCVILDSEGKLLLIRRKNPPFAGALALPGGFVELGENVEDACRREILEETGIRLEKLYLVGIYSDPHRDPRGHICSVAFASRISKKRPIAGSDALKVLWTQSWKKAKVAFDHTKIISDALRLFKSSIERSLR